MKALLRDVSYGFRLMSRAPGFSAIAILALALGIGANTAIFSVVNTVLLQRLPVPDPEQLVVFMHRHERRNFSSPGTPYADVCEWRRDLRSFENVSAYQQTSVNISSGDEPERVTVAKVNASFFPMLRVRPVLGRDFLPEEDRPGAAHVAILTHDLWKRRFGASPNLAGAAITLDGEAYTVVGVLPPRFRFTGQPADLYTPLALSEARGPIVPVTAYGRLKPDVTALHAQPELDAVTAATIARLPRYKGWRLRASEIREWIVPDVRVSLWVLLGAVGLVLLIACANVAGLLLSRAAARRREFAIRASLGAGRGRLIRQLMGETAPLCLLGGSLGLLLAWWGVQFVPQLGLTRIPRLQESRVDTLVLAFTAAVSLLTCLLAGLAPAISFSRPDVRESLQEGGRSGGTGLRGSRLRAGLVVMEVAFALLLSIGATLMLRTLHTLSSVNPGFQPDNLLTASIDLPRARYRDRDRIAGFYEQLLERMRAAPGVVSACLTDSLPLGGNYFRADFLVEGRQYAEHDNSRMLNTRTVDSDYFRTLRIPLLGGRYFTAQDRDGAPPVLIVNETTAKRLFGSEIPIGRRMGSPKDWRTIVGVIADVRHTDVSMTPDTEVLLPFAQKPMAAATMVIRVSPAIYPDPMLAAPLLRRMVASLDRNQAVYRVASMENIMAGRLSPRRVNMILMCLFAGLAMLLAAVGIYGVLSYAVERRTHEIGVRMALGAQRGDVQRMVVRQALTLAAAGIGMGLAAGLAFTRVLRTLLYGVSATDPVIFAGATLLLATVAAVAAYIPARRATEIDPVIALRHE